MRKINDNCINCGCCAGVCPCGAITEEGMKHEVNKKCTDCGACDGVCPVDAIEVPAKK